MSAVLYKNEPRMRLTEATILTHCIFYSTLCVEQLQSDSFTDKHSLDKAK